MEQPPIDLALNYLPSKPPKTDYGIGCIGAGFIMRECHLVAYVKAQKLLPELPAFRKYTTPIVK